MKRLLNLLFFIIVFVSTFGCKETTNETTKELSSQNNINYTELDFNSIYKSKNSPSLDSWINYSELSNYIEQLNSKDYSSLIDNKKYLVRFFNGIKNTIPNNINKPEIKSRLTVIETDFLKFESMLSNYEIDKINKISMVKKINNSFSNLNFQIDKLIEKQEIITLE